jgi:hypothetical protein
MAKSARLFLKTLLIVTLSASLFGWGFAVERYKVFPIGLLRNISASLGPPRWSLDLPSQSPAVASLVSIPYLQGQFDPHAKTAGVLFQERDLVSPGLNFFSALGHGDAFLIDNDGHSRWRWSLDRYFNPYELRESQVDFAFPHLFPGGEVLAYVAERALLKLDRSSHLIWKYKAHIHHDAFVASDGKIWILTHVRRRAPEIDPRYISVLDQIDVLSAEGKRERSIPLLELVESSPYAGLLPRTMGLALPPDTTTVDVLHSNHIEVFDGALEGKSPLYRRGNFLISMRNINSIAIVDGQTLKILWLWGPTNLTLQHNPTILPSGNVLVFNNGTKSSSIVEVDPRRNTVVWRYAPSQDFLSYIRGACQRLPNGNTLITLSMPGYALEVTPDGKTVWKFANPSLGSGGVRYSIYRMTRFSVPELPFLTENSSHS